jgi:thymidylate synthase
MLHGMMEPRMLRKELEEVKEIATQRKELLMRWNDERVKEGEPCPFCKTCTQFDYAKGSHVKLVMIDVHDDDCELAKELEDDNMG